MIDSTDTQLFTSKISILTIPRGNFWIFKSGILEIMFRLIDVYENRSSSRYSDNDMLSISSTSDRSFNGSIDNNSSGGSDNDEDRPIKYEDHLSNSVHFNNNEEVESFKEGAAIEDDGLFFHLAFTTEEVTLMCSTKLIQKYLSKPIKLDEDSTLISDEFFIMQVFSDGSNIGKKILELTQPLSLNNISLFFISNYFSDLVLVPIKDKRKALRILEEKDSDNCNDELEVKTFELFKENNIKPILDTEVKLLLTGARSGDSVEVLRQTAESIARLHTESTDNDNRIGKSRDDRTFPKYFAITRTPTEEIGLLLPYENNELSKLNFSKSNIMGSLQDYYYPIFIDLKKLPLDLKGIVAGIASKLLTMNIDEMSYLSLGRSGVVLIPDLFKETVEEKLYL